MDSNPDPGPAYHYTAAGRLKKRIWARGNTTRYDFDDGGRMIHTRYFAASTAQGTVDTAATGDDPVTADSSFDYDALGRLEEAANDHSTIAYGYHSDLLTLATETIAIDPDGPNTPPGSGPRAAVTRTFERGRDSLLRPDGYLFKNGATVEANVTYGYHSTHGRLDEVSGVHAGAPREFNWTYEPEAYGLPAAVTGPQHIVALNWKADRDVLHSRANGERYDDNDVISSYEYAVNDIGQRTGVTLGGDQFSVTGINWGYDSMGQVKTADRAGGTAGDRGYKWDGIGNRYRSSKNTTDPDDPNIASSDLSVYRVATGGSSAAGANALNHYGRVEIDGTTGVDQNYDADGNQETGRYPSTATGTRYWDGENRMCRTTVGSTDTYYAYDPFGRRVAKYQGSDTDMTGRTYFYDGWNAAAECAIGASTYPLDRTYTWGPDLSGSMQGAGGVGGLLAVEIETGTDAGVYYPTFDGNGNVSEYLDSGGQAIAHFEYDPFGDLVLANGDDFALFNYRFSTKPLDTETGYYYYGYRYYDPATGRWPSRDPIEEEGGMNLYGFINNSALGSLDFIGFARYEYDGQGFHLHANCGEKKLTYRVAFDENGGMTFSPKKNHEAEFDLEKAKKHFDGETICKDGAKNMRQAVADYWKTAADKPGVAAQGRGLRRAIGAAKRAAAAAGRLTPLLALALAVVQTGEAADTSGQLLEAIQEGNLPKTEELTQKLSNQIPVPFMQSSIYMELNELTEAAALEARAKSCKCIDDDCDR
jgi:RHS repeat-associated protein